MASDQIKIIKIEPLQDPEFIKPQKLYFEKNGVQKSWEIAQTHDSVSVLLYHESLKSFVFVRQFRPAVYLQNNHGMTVELCAGLVDKAKPQEVIAQEEIIEECGYAVPLEAIEKITSFYTAVGFAGGKQTLYFAQIDTHMQINEGGGIDEEEIEVVYIALEEIHAFIQDETIAKTPGLMYAIMWFLTNK